MDFDWPLSKVWSGFINPHYECSKECPFCTGSGYSPEADRLKALWYGSLHDAGFRPEDNGSVPFPASHPYIAALAARNYPGNQRGQEYEAQRLADHFNGSWGHHLNADDIAALIAADRLWDFTRVPRTDEQREIVRQKKASGGNCWLPESNGYVPTPAEVNEWSLHGLGHDSINSGTCVRARCEREGHAVNCLHCEGHGTIWRTKADEAAAEAWESTEPPAGDGWQMWETVSEGSPISAVCDSPESLARWMVDNEPRMGLDADTTYEQWLAMIRQGWCPSLVSNGGQVVTGAQAAGLGI